MLVGDVIAKITKAVGIEPCEACKQRQKALNDLSLGVLKILGMVGKVDDEGSELSVDERGAGGPGAAKGAGGG